MKIDAGSHKSGHNQEHHHLKVLQNSIFERIKNREEEEKKQTHPSIMMLKRPYFKSTLNQQALPFSGT